MPNGHELRFPICRKCNNGDLAPLSDFYTTRNGSDSVALRFKAWACTNPACGFCIRMGKGGEVQYGEVQTEAEEKRRTV